MIFFVRKEINYNVLVTFPGSGLSWTMDEGTKGLLFARHNNASWFLKGKGATKQREKSKNNEVYSDIHF